VPLTLQIHQQIPPGPQRRQRVQPAQQRLLGRQHLLGLMGDHCPDQRRLVGEVVVDLRGAHPGGAARFVAVDLTDLDSVGRFAEDAAGADILINNAGVFEFFPTAEQTVASYDTMFDVNVRAAFFLTAAIAPKMAARGGGSIVNVNTMAAAFGMPGAAAYGASKAALSALTKMWAAEFSKDGVRVNTVAPGPTLTEGTGPELADQVGATTLMGRPADVREIGEAMVFLASPRASYITGANLAVDGGRTAA
jgi:NAD(P)-dependent dehydrogenase (short-subunit alcohol dehydrogenase family)